MLLDFSQNNMYVLFEITENQNVALKYFSNAELKGSEKKDIDDCLISDVHISGEIPDGRFGAKHVETSEMKKLKYEKHNYYENEYGNKLEFFLKSEKVEMTVHYQFYNGISVVRAWKTVKNISDEIIGLEYVPSFAYTGLDENNLKVMIPHNSWRRELDWKEYTPCELGFNRYTVMGTKRIAVSNTGSNSSKEYLPMAAVVNDNSVLMWQIENNGSWQWEISDANDLVYLKISGPDDQQNSWYKELAPGESFESVKAALTVADKFDAALSAMTWYRRIIFNDSEENRKLPVIFNDYMNCLWADPTEEKLIPMIDIAADLGSEYYCMDAGWYADGTWWETVGEWKEQKKRFPNGIRKVFDYARSKGMIPGIWLEIEVMGINCPVLDKFEDECFFMRHGKRVVNRGRYQLDFRSEKVRAYATKVVDRVVMEYGAGYIKLDYNCTPGVGTEVDADSFGDGLLGHTHAYLDWIREIKAKYPELILENCSSGGMRMDYAMLSEHHLQSVTDQEDFKYLAYIAAAAPTAVLPEQAAVWAYPVETNSADETALIMVSSMLQRIHLSGQVDKMSEKNTQLIKEAISCYKHIRGDIHASVPYYPLGIPQLGDDVICYGFEFDGGVRLAAMCLNESTKTLMVPVEYESAEILYPSDSQIKLSDAENGLKIDFPSACTAAIIELTKKER